MECLPVTKLNDADQWTYEIKLDGYRAIAVKSALTINLFSRRESRSTQGASQSIARDARGDDWYHAVPGEFVHEQIQETGLH
jgi:ATP-dependent DNA ligase